MRSGNDHALIEDPAPFTVAINRYRSITLLKNPVESYPIRDNACDKDIAWVEQAAAMGAVVKGDN